MDGRFPIGSSNRHDSPIAPRTLIRRPRRGATPAPAADDGALVAALRDGDEAAFEAIYDRYHLGLLGFCRHMLGSQPEAEDALQLVLLSAYDGLRRDDRRVELKPWLYAVARNRCTSMLRARRDERPLGAEREPSTVGLALADEVEQREELKAMLRDVAGLPEEQRAALVLAELGDLSQEEIGVSLGVPTVKVKALIFQARTSLIGARRARQAPCEEIREQLATLRGSALRRTTITRHLDSCAACAAFREEVRLQRTALGCVLPVAPVFALKHELLAGVLASGASGAAVTAGLGGAVAGGALGPAAVGAGSVTGAGALVGSGATGMVAAAASTAGVAKVLLAVVVAGGIAGGAVATEQATRGHATSPPARVRSAPAVGGSRPAAPPAATPVPPGANARRAAVAAKRAAARRTAATRREAAAVRRSARSAARRTRTAKAKAANGRGTPILPRGTRSRGRGTTTSPGAGAAGRGTTSTPAPGHTTPRPAAGAKAKVAARPTSPGRPAKQQPSSGLPHGTRSGGVAATAKGRPSTPSKER